MSLKGKVFEDKNGRIHTVTDTNENIAILDSGQKVAVERLYDNNFYTEQVNNNSFEEKQNSFYQSLTNQLKNIPTENIQDIPSSHNVQVNQPVVESHQDHMRTMKGKKSVQSNEEIERRKIEMAEKAKNINREIESNKKAFENLVSDEDYDEDEKIPVNRNFENVTYDTDRDISVTMYDENQQIIQNQKKDSVSRRKQIRKQDPMYQMFKNVKRTTTFKLNMDVDQKIPKKDFIKMWEENYEKSILDYLAEEIADELLKDPKDLKKQIFESLKEHVYGKTRKTRKKTKKDDK